MSFMKVFVSYLLFKDSKGLKQIPLLCTNNPCNIRTDFPKRLSKHSIKSSQQQSANNFIPWQISQDLSVLGSTEGGDWHIPWDTTSFHQWIF